MQIDIWAILESLSRKFTFHWYTTRITGIYMKTFVHLWQYLAELFLEWEMFQLNVVEKIKLHNLCAVYEIMSKNVLEPNRPQMAIWRRVACWINKATRAQAHASARAHTHTQICKTYCFSTATVVSRTRSVLRYTYIVCLVKNSVFKMLIALLKLFIK